MNVHDAKLELTEKRYKPPVSYFFIEAVVMVSVAIALVSFFA